MAYEAKPGDMSLFANEKTSDKSPSLTGSFVAHRDIRAGEKVGVSLWRGKPDSKVVYSGKVQDHRVKNPKEAALIKALDAADETARRNKAPRVEEDFSDFPF